MTFTESSTVESLFREILVGLTSQRAACPVFAVPPTRVAERADHA